jgi:hypothetical protein
MPHNGKQAHGHNTHIIELRQVLYPWHPWYGLRVGVHAHIGFVTKVWVVQGACNLQRLTKRMRRESLQGIFAYHAFS